MADANPASGSGKTRRQAAKVTTAPEADMAKTEAPTVVPVEEAPYGRHSDGRPYDKGPKLDPSTQSYLPAIWTEEVESVDQFGNRRTHTIVIEDK